MNEELIKLKNTGLETNKTSNIQNASGHKRTKSPKKLKNLVIPSREYYQTPSEVTNAKISTIILSKDSIVSSQTNTRPKDFSDYLGKPATNQKPESMFNRSDICQTKTHIEKIKSEAKKQISFFKPKFETKTRTDNLSFVNKNAPQKHNNQIEIKTPSTRKVISFTTIQSSLFKKNKKIEIVKFAGKKLAIGKPNQSFKQTITSFHKIAYFQTSQIMILIENEQFLSKFLKCFYNEEPIVDMFYEFNAWVEKTDFQPLIDKMSGPIAKNLCKVSLLYERMSLYICYFIYMMDFQKEEIIFLKKTTGYIYLNFILMVAQLKPFIPEVIL